MNIENVEEHLLELPFYRVHSGLVHFMNFGVLKTIFQEPPRTQTTLRTLVTGDSGGRKGWILLEQVK